MRVVEKSTFSLLSIALSHVMITWWGHGGEILQPSFPVVLGWASQQTTISCMHWELDSIKTVEVSSSLAWFKPDGPNPALGAHGSTRGHTLEDQSTLTHPAAKRAVLAASVLAFLWKPQAQEMSRRCSPICQYTFTHPLGYISPPTIIPGTLPTPAPTSFICSLLKK